MIIQELMTITGPGKSNSVILCGLPCQTQPTNPSYNLLESLFRIHTEPMYSFPAFPLLQSSHIHKRKIPNPPLYFVTTYPAHSTSKN